MEDISFDINSFLTGDEAEALFNGAQLPEEPEREPGKDTEEIIDNKETPAEEPEKQAPEKVGVEEKDETGNDAAPEDGGSSPSAFYSSIANALKNDGIFPDFDDKDIEAVKTPEDFAELFEKAVTSRVDEKTRRVDAALGNGVAPDTVRMYEQTLQYLGSINDEALSAEGEDAEDLRRQLIYNDLINRGYSQEKANKRIEQLFNSGDDVEEAKDALVALTQFYKKGYDDVQKEAQKKVEAAKAAQKQNADKFKKMVLEDEFKLGENALDKRTRQQIFDAVSKPVYKDPDSGQLLTQVQRFQKEQPLEFLKQIGLWFVLTEGGKNLNGFTREQVRAEKNKNIRELEQKINASRLNPDGSLNYVGGINHDDPLLSDGWKVDFGRGNDENF